MKARKRVAKRRFSIQRVRMPNPFDDEAGSFIVLVNEEAQYSLWPSFREVPAGWSAAGPSGGRQLCLDWIETNWTDMRPRSLASNEAR
jgi:MbtH protein